jgi:polyferredoxin
MLRKIRVFAAILVGLLFIAIFIDFRGLLPDGLVNFVSKTQFLPSILRTARMGLLASLALVLLVALTLLTGRTYCSFLCPLGIMQDFFSRMGKKLKLSVKLKYRKPLNVLRYILLALATVVFYWRIGFPAQSVGSVQHFRAGIQLFGSAGCYFG